MTSFFRFVNKRAICRLGIISLAHAPVHVTDFPVVNVHVDELSSAWIWQNKLCETLSANVNINYRLPIKVYYRICTPRHIRIEITHSGFHDLFLKSMKNRWNHLHHSFKWYIFYLFSLCAATFGNFSPEEYSWNQLNNWKNHPGVFQVS